MRKTVPSLLLAFLLISCSPASLPVGEAATKTAPTAAPVEPVETPTAAPTITSTPQPSPSPEPSPTFVPTQAGPKTGDTKAKNGFTYTYLIPNGNQEFAGYYRPLTVDFPLWDKHPFSSALSPGGNPKEKKPDKPYVGPTTVYIQLGVPDETALKGFTHTVQPGTYQSIYGSTMFSRLIEIYGIRIRAKDESELFDAKLNDGEISKTFKVGDQSYDWPVSPESGATIYVINYDTLAPTPENGFWQFPTPSGNKFRVGFLGLDGKGIIGVIASKDPISKLAKKEIPLLLLWHEAVALSSDNVKGAGYAIFYQMLEQYSKTPPNPQLIIIK